MCATCGCSVPHVHAQPAGRTVLLEQDILAKNNRLAERNRAWFASRRIAAFNLMSSPGSGKTTLLERTIERLRGRAGVSVIEGDQETLRDAERIRGTGARAVQINTGSGCHLDAGMVADALRALDPPRGSLLFIENVGNLVCPALLRSRRGAQGGDRLGDRRRGQAAEVSPHVPRLRRAGPQQAGLAAAPPVRSRAVLRVRPDGESAAPGLPGLRAPGRRSRGVVQLAGRPERSARGGALRKAVSRCWDRCSLSDCCSG